MLCLHYEVQYCKEMCKLAQSQKERSCVVVASAHSGGIGVTTQRAAAPLGLAGAHVSFLTHGLTSELAARLLRQQPAVLATSQVASLLLPKHGPLELFQVTQNT